MRFWYLSLSLFFSYSSFGDDASERLAAMHECVGSKEPPQVWNSCERSGHSDKVVTTREVKANIERKRTEDNGNVEFLLSYGAEFYTIKIPKKEFDRSPGGNTAKVQITGAGPIQNELFYISLGSNFHPNEFYTSIKCINEKNAGLKNLQPVMIHAARLSSVENLRITEREARSRIERSLFLKVHDQERIRCFNAKMEMLRRNSWCKSADSLVDGAICTTDSSQCIGGETKITEDQKLTLSKTLREEYADHSQKADATLSKCAIAAKYLKIDMNSKPLISDPLTDGLVPKVTR